MVFNRLSVKRKEEVACVKRFLNNNNNEFEESEIIPNKEENNIVDVFFKDKKFQIVYTDFKFKKAEHTAPKDRWGVRLINGPARSCQEIWKDFLIEPIKKKSKYRKSAKGIILLIDSWIEPPTIEDQIRIFKKSKEVKKLGFLGFDEIYLVCPEKNIKIYP